MNTEQLKEIGLTEEQIQGVFKLRGQEIEQANAIEQELETQKKENESLKDQIQTANKQIADFKEMDIDSIKQRAEEYQSKFEESENERKKELDNANLNYAIELGLVKAGARNTKATRALLDFDTLKDSRNLESDIKTQIEQLKESDGYLFESKEQEAKQPISKGNTISNNKPVEEMSYAEMLEASKKGLM